MWISMDFIRVAPSFHSCHSIYVIWYLCFQVTSYFSHISVAADIVQCGTGKVHLSTQIS